GGRPYTPGRGHLSKESMREGRAIYFLTLSQLPQSFPQLSQIMRASSGQASSQRIGSPYEQLAVSDTLLRCRSVPLHSLAASPRITGDSTPGEWKFRRSPTVTQSRDMARS